jgi:U-box domain
MTTIDDQQQQQKKEKNGNDNVVDAEEDVDLETGAMAIVASNEEMMMIHRSEEENAIDNSELELVDDGTLHSNDAEDVRVIHKEEEEEETCVDQSKNGMEDEDEDVPTVIRVDGEDVDESKIVPIHSTSSSETRREFLLSTIFHCPITKQLFQDPVVAVDGITYERRAILQRDGENVTSPTGDDDDDDDLKANQHLNRYYPNRALQQVLADRLLLWKDDTIAGNDDYHHHHRPLPDAYHCPITFGIIHDPVIDPEGNTYERRAIQLWIRANHNCPLSRKPLQESQLYENQALRQVLQEEAERSDDSIHPGIREWKQEPKPKPLSPLDASLLLLDKASGSGSSGVVEPTPEELEALRRQQVVETRVFTFFCVILLFLTIYIIPYGTVLVLIYMLLVCLYANVPHHNSSGREPQPSSTAAAAAAAATTTTATTTTTLQAVEEV